LTLPAPVCVYLCALAIFPRSAHAVDVKALAAYLTARLRDIPFDGASLDVKQFAHGQSNPVRARVCLTGDPFGMMTHTARMYAHTGTTPAVHAPANFFCCCCCDPMILLMGLWLGACLRPCADVPAAFVGRAAVRAAEAAPGGATARRARGGPRVPRHVRTVCAPAAAVAAGVSRAIVRGHCWCWRRYGIVPVPKTRLFCEDPSVLGTPFFMYDYVPGAHFADPSLATLPREARRPVYVASGRGAAAVAGWWWLGSGGGRVGW
jgi:hypothetical protein